MGWTFIRGATKQEVIDECLTRKPFNYVGKSVYDRVLDKSVQGSALWVVFERTITDPATGAPAQVERWIALFLLQANQGCYGYKDMDEGAGPYTYSCPLRFLDLAPEANAEWRENVRAYWAAKARVRKIRKELKVGTRLKLKGSRISEVTVTRIEGTKVYGLSGNSYYRIPPRLIDDIIT